MIIDLSHNAELKWYEKQRENDRKLQPKFYMDNKKCFW